MNSCCRVGKKLCSTCSEEVEVGGFFAPGVSVHGANRALALTNTTLRKERLGAPVAVWHLLVYHCIHRWPPSVRLRGQDLGTETRQCHRRRVVSKMHRVARGAASSLRTQVRALWCSSGLWALEEALEEVPLGVVQWWLSTCSAASSVTWCPACVCVSPSCGGLQ